MNAVRLDPIQIIDSLMNSTKIVRGEILDLKRIDRILESLIESLTQNDVRNEFFRKGLGVLKSAIPLDIYLTENDWSNLANRVRGAVNSLFKMLTLPDQRSFLVSAEDHRSLQVGAKRKEPLNPETVAKLIEGSHAKELRELTKDPSIVSLPEAIVNQIWDWVDQNGDIEILKNLLEYFWIDSRKIAEFLIRHNSNDAVLEALAIPLIPYHFHRLPKPQQDWIAQWIQRANEPSYEVPYDTRQLSYPAPIEEYLDRSLLNAPPVPGFPVLTFTAENENERHCEAENKYLKDFLEALTALLKTLGYSAIFPSSSSFIPVEMTREYLTQIERLFLEIPENVARDSSIQSLMKFYDQIKPGFERFMIDQFRFEAELRAMVDSKVPEWTRTDSRGRWPHGNLYARLIKDLKGYLTRNGIGAPDMSQETYENQIDSILESIPPIFYDDHPEVLVIMNHWIDIKAGNTQLFDLLHNFLKASVQKKVGFDKDFDEKKDEGLFFVHFKNAVSQGELETIQKSLSSSDCSGLKPAEIEQIIWAADKNILLILMEQAPFKDLSAPFLLRCITGFLQVEKFDQVKILMGAQNFELSVEQCLDLQTKVGLTSSQELQDIVQGMVLLHFS